MREILDFLIRHGYVVLFWWVFLEQLGLALPSVPILLAAGALAGSHQLSLTTTLGLSVVASLCSDTFWFCFGRLRGNRVLRWICKISLEPDSCVRRTQDLYARYGARSLLFAKFVPGFGAVAAPLAGIFRMRLVRFALFDAMGALAWSGSYVGLGFIFSNQLEDIARYALRLGEFLGVLLITGLVAYVARKYTQRRKFLHDLRIARITPAELKQRLDAGESIQIVDLRSSIDFEAEPITLPGAIHFDPKEIEQRVSQIAIDRDVVLYCT